MRYRQWVPQTMNERVQHIVVPVNGGQSDAPAIRLALRLGSTHPLRLTLINVVEVVQAMPLDAELPTEIYRGESILRQAEVTARAETRHKRTSILTELLQARSAGSALVEEALELQADAIVMAAGLRAKFGKTTLGETAGYILKMAPCEVILLRRTVDEASLEQTGIGANQQSMRHQ